jgi:hypothetical protein
MRQFTTDDLSMRIGDVTDTASREPVALIEDGTFRFVLMSFEHYDRTCIGGEPRRACLTTEMPEIDRQRFADRIDRLARGEGYDDEP